MEVPRIPVNRATVIDNSATVIDNTSEGRYVTFNPVAM